MEARTDIDVISAPYFKRQDEKVHIVMEKYQPKPLLDMYRPVEKLPEGDICEVDIVGMGCTLIKVELLKNMFKSFRTPFEYTTELLDVKEAVLTERKLGEDVSFCERVKKLGYHVWIHYT